MISLRPRGPFSLDASIRFLEGFTPAAYQGADGPLRLAFPTRVSAEWKTISSAVRQKSAGKVDLEVNGDEAAAQRDVARILSLDVDGTEFPDIDDPVVQQLMTRFPGLRPVCFHSPYEAAAWSIIGQRIRMTQAAGIKAAITTRHGEVVNVDGIAIAAFPTPERLLEIHEFPGLNDVKIGRLHAVANAALDGELDPVMLRGMPSDDALARLQRIAGIGPFSAELILIRGAGHPDLFPTKEKRLHRAMSLAYNVDATDVDRLASIAATWSPFRSWVALLFRASAA